LREIGIASSRSGNLPDATRHRDTRPFAPNFPRILDNSVLIHARERYLTASLLGATARWPAFEVDKELLEQGDG